MLSDDEHRITALCAKHHDKVPICGDSSDVYLKIIRDCMDKMDKLIEDRSKNDD